MDRAILAIQTTLEDAGIEFTGNPLVNPGVILNLKHDTWMVFTSQLQ